MKITLTWALCFPHSTAPAGKVHRPGTGKWWGGTAARSSCSKCFLNWENCDRRHSVRGCLWKSHHVFKLLTSCAYPTFTPSAWFWLVMLSTHQRALHHPPCRSGCSAARSAPAVNCPGWAAVFQSGTDRWTAPSYWPAHRERWENISNMLR